MRDKHCKQKIQSLLFTAYEGCLDVIHWKENISASGQISHLGMFIYMACTSDLFTWCSYIVLKIEKLFTRHLVSVAKRKKDCVSETTAVGGQGDYNRREILNSTLKPARTRGGFVHSNMVKVWVNRDCKELGERPKDGAREKSNLGSCQQSKILSKWLFRILHKNWAWSQSLQARVRQRGVSGWGFW